MLCIRRGGGLAEAAAVCIPLLGTGDAGKLAGSAPMTARSASDDEVEC